MWGRQKAYGSLFSSGLAQTWGAGHLALGSAAGSLHEGKAHSSTGMPRGYPYRCIEVQGVLAPLAHTSIATSSPASIQGRHGYHSASFMSTVKALSSAAFPSSNYGSTTGLAISRGFLDSPQPLKLGWLSHKVNTTSWSGLFCCTCRQPLHVTSKQGSKR